MNHTRWLDHALREYESDPEFLAEASAFEIMERASQLMEPGRLSRSELAERMGVSRAYVTRLFKAPPNLTLRTVWQLALALKAKVAVDLYLPEPEAGQVPLTFDTNLASDMEQWKTTAGAIRLTINYTGTADKTADDDRWTPPSEYAKVA